MVFLKPKPLTIKGWGRGGGGFLVGPSLPNHDVKGLERQDIAETKERKKTKPRVDYIRQGERETKYRK